MEVGKMALYLMFRMSGVYERHHVIPLSILGEDHSSNIQKLDKATHKELHKALNLSSNDLREFRKDTNGILFRTPRDLDKKHDLRLRYIDWVENLDKHVIKAHDSSFGRQAIRKQRRFERLSGVNGLPQPPILIKWKDFADSSEKSSVIHRVAMEKFEILCEIEKQIATVFLSQFD